MTTKPDYDVLVSLSTPLLSKSARRRFPAAMTLGDCIKQVARSQPADQTERRVVQQIQREIGGARFDILVVFQGGKTEKVKPDTQLSDIATTRDVRTPDGIQKLWVAQVELQAYAPVGVA